MLESYTKLSLVAR